MRRIPRCSQQGQRHRDCLDAVLHIDAVQLEVKPVAAWYFTAEAKFDAAMFYAVRKGVAVRFDTERWRLVVAGAVVPRRAKITREPCVPIDV